MPSLISSRTGVSGPRPFGDAAHGDVAVGDHADHLVAVAHRDRPGVGAEHEARRLRAVWSALTVSTSVVITSLIFMAALLVWIRPLNERLERAVPRL